MRIEGTQTNDKLEIKATQKHVQKGDRKNIETHPKYMPNPSQNRWTIINKTLPKIYIIYIYQNSIIYTIYILYILFIFYILLYCIARWNGSATVFGSATEFNSATIFISAIEASANNGVLCAAAQFLSTAQVAQAFCKGAQLTLIPKPFFVVKIVKFIK